MTCRDKGPLAAHETRVRRSSTEPSSVQGADPSGSLTLLAQLMQEQLVLPEDLNHLSPESRQELHDCRVREDLLPRLVGHRLLTPYQAECLMTRGISGLRYGNYRVLELIGRGAMGTVYQAEHIYLRQVVALKVIASSACADPLGLARFTAEIRTVARLRHPNIVSAIDAGQTQPADSWDGASHYFVMEYVAGQNLDEMVMERGALLVDNACDIIYQISGALAELNKCQLVHRDIKPSNIRVTPENHAMLMDFGLVRYFSSGRTEPGMMMGTPDYMAPEQAVDAHLADVRSDIYGLGSTFYWCLTGRPPFSSTQWTDRELCQRQNQPPPSIRDHRPDLSPELEPHDGTQSIRPDRDARGLDKGVTPFSPTAVSGRCPS